MSRDGCGAEIGVAVHGCGAEIGVGVQYGQQI